MSQLEVRLLGRFEAYLDGKPAKGFDSDKVRALLSYLVVEADRPHSREKLAGLLWPDYPESSARSSLRRALSNLRKVIGDRGAEPTFLIISRQDVQFNRESEAWVDVIRFQDLQRGRGEGRPSQERFMEAIDLYRGAFLEGFSLPDCEAYEDWLRQTRESMQQQVIGQMEGSANLLEGSGQYQEAVVLARRQLEINPYQELAHRQLMRLLALSGRRSEALAQYETLEHTLAKELEVEPSAETQSLYEAIRSGDYEEGGLGGSDQAVRGYKLKELIGSGHFGVVYRAQQPAIGRDVAIKIIQPKYADDPAFIRRFEVEAQLVARLEHPRIVPLYDYWREPGGAFLVMRLLRGGSLEDALERGPWNPEPAVELVDQLASALNTAHRQGVVHRDLKPANILLDNDGNTYLSDFGVASLVGPMSALDDDLAGIDYGRSSGSLGYLSPESIRNEKATPLTDIYSFGVLLYELLTARHPFPNSQGQELLDKHLKEPLPSVQSIRPELPAAADEVIQKATSKIPSERYSNVNALAEAFCRAFAGDEVAESSTAAAEIRNPFKGLRPFQEADSSDFFGRDDLIKRLAAKVASSQFLALVGPSGSGKSSAVKAGLIPALRQGDVAGSQNWFIVEMTPGSRPLEELETTLLRIAVNPPESLLGQLKEDDRGLLRAVRRALPDDESRVLMVIDQFEELFTLLREEEEQEHFLSSLMAAATEPDSPLRLIITLRADFYDRPLQYSGFGELMRQNTEVVLPLSADEVERVVTEPATRVGLSLDSGLLGEITAHVSDQPGALPLLQYALTELFERRENGRLSLDIYRSIGGITGALARRAEELYTDFDLSGQEIIRQLFLRLVTIGEGGDYTSRRLLKSEITALGEETGRWEDIIDAYGSARLLTFDRDQATRVPTVELAHEALLSEWERLQQWLAKSRDDLFQQRRLQTLTQEWLDGGRKAGLLLRETRLDQFASWAENTNLVLGSDETAYLEASIIARQERESEEQFRRQRELETAQILAETERQRAEEQTAAAQGLRQRAYFLAGALALAVILAAAAVAFSRQSAQNADLAATREAEALAEANQRATAEALAITEAEARATQQAIAEENAAQAQSLALAASSRLALNAGDTDLAIALAMEANRIPDPPAQAQLALADAAYEPGTRRLLEGHDARRIYSLSLNSDASQLLSGAVDRSMILWDMSSGEPMQKYGGFRGSVTSVHYPTDDKEALVGVLDGSVRLLDLETGDETSRFVLRPPIIGAALSRDGRSALWSSDSGQMVLLDLEEGEITRTFGEAPGEDLAKVVSAVAFHPAGALGVSGHVDGQMRLWDLASGDEVGQFNNDTAAIEDLAITSDGEIVLSADANGSVTAWGLNSGDLLWKYEPNSIEDKIYRLAKQESDGRIVAGAMNGSLRLFDRDSGAVEKLEKQEHDGWVSALEVSTDGQMAISGGTEGGIIVWDLISGESLQTIEGIESFAIGTPLLSLALSSEMKTALAGYENGVIARWDLETGELLDRYTEDEWNVESISFQPGDRSAIAVTVLGELKQLNIAEGIFTPLVQRGSTVWPWISPSGDWRTVIVSADSFVELGAAGALLFKLDLADGKVERLRGGNETNVRAVAINSDGSQALSGDENGIVVLWDLDTGEVISQLPQRGEGVRRVAFNPDETSALVSYFDGGLILWDPVNEELLQEFPIVLNAESIDFSPDGRIVYAALSSGEIQLWDVESGEELDLFAGHTNIIWDLELSADGQTAVSSSEDGDVRVWDLSNGASLGSLPWPEPQFAVTISPLGRQALTGVGGDLLLWDLENREVIRRLDGHDQPIFDIAFSPDGLRAVSSAGSPFEADPSSLIYWDVESGEKLLELDAEAQLYTVSFSPDGRQAVISSNLSSTNPPLFIWDLSTGKVIDRFQTGPMELNISSSAVSPDGQTVLGGFLNDPVERDWVRLYDFESGEILHSMTGHENSIIDMAYLPDSSSAISVSWDRSLILWDLENGEIAKRLSGRNADLFAVAVDPSNRYAMVGDGEGLLFVWDIETGEVIRNYQGHFGPLTHVSISPDGKTAMSSAFDGTVRIWRIDPEPEDLMQWAMENRYVRDLTCDERALYRINPPCE